MFMPSYVTCSECNAKVDRFSDDSDSWIVVRLGASDGTWLCGKCAIDPSVNPVSTWEKFLLRENEKRALAAPKKDLHPLQKEFGFNAPEDGSAIRYDDDLQRHLAVFAIDGAKAVVPWINFRFWWFLHNCVAHVAIGILPIRAMFRFHDFTSRRMHGVKTTQRQDS